MSESAGALMHYDELVAQVVAQCYGKQFSRRFLFLLQLIFIKINREILFIFCVLCSGLYEAVSSFFVQYRPLVYDLKNGVSYKSLKFFQIGYKAVLGKS